MEYNFEFLTNIKYVTEIQVCFYDLWFFPIFLEHAKFAIWSGNSRGSIGGERWAIVWGRVMGFGNGRC